MKKVVYALIALLFLSCTGSSHQSSGVFSQIVTAQTIAFLLSEKPSDLDAGLYLYRNPLTRPMVESFYTRLTGSWEISAAVLAAADSNDIALPLAFSLAWVESSFRVRAVNRNASSVDRGLFQLNSRTFPALKEEQFFNPVTNARYGLAHLRYCLEVGRTKVVALAMYNAGIMRVRSGTPYATMHYLARLLEYEANLEDSFEQMLTDGAEIARLMGVNQTRGDS